MTVSKTCRVPESGRLCRKILQNNVKRSANKNWGVSHGLKEQLLTYSTVYCALTFAASILDQFETVKHVNHFHLHVLLIGKWVV